MNAPLRLLYLHLHTLVDYTCTPILSSLVCCCLDYYCLTIWPRRWLLRNTWRYMYTYYYTLYKWMDTACSYDRAVRLKVTRDSWLVLWLTKRPWNHGPPRDDSPEDVARFDHLCLNFMFHVWCSFLSFRYFEFANRHVMWRCSLLWIYAFHFLFFSHHGARMIQ
jgi:hypothetical protein